MNKKLNNTTDKSAPYRTLSLNKVDAPNKHTNEPKNRVITTGDDLRCKGGKR